MLANNRDVDLGALLLKSAIRSKYDAEKTIFVQGDPADSVFYIEIGKVKKLYASSCGRERVVAIFKAGEFLSIDCIAGKDTCSMSAVALTDATVLRIPKFALLRALSEHQGLAELFITFLINRHRDYESDLVTHLFDPSEQRLARILLLLSEETDGQERTVPKISQESLADMVGTTRPRINHFMQKFKKLGVIDDQKAIRLHPSFAEIVQFEKLE